MGRGPSAKIVAFCVIFLALVTACTYRSSPTLSETDPSSLYRFEYAPSALSVLGDDFESYDVTVKRTQPTDSTVQVFLQDHQNKRLVGVFGPTKDTVMSSRLHSRNVYRFSFVDSQSDSEGLKNVELDFEIRPSRHHDKDFSLPWPTNWDLGYFWVKNGAVISSRNTEPILDSFQAGRPDHPPMRIKADYGVFEGTVSVNGLIQTTEGLQVEDPVTPGPDVEFIFNHARGALVVNPIGFQALDGRRAYQNFLISVQDSSNFELKIATPELPVNPKIPVEQTKSGHVRFDHKNRTLVLCGEKMVPFEQVQGIFLHPTDGKTHLIFSPTTGMASLGSWKVPEESVRPGDRFNNYLVKFNCADGLGNQSGKWKKLHDASLPPIQASLARMQKEILELDRVYARSEVRVDFEGSCKSPFSDAQFAFASSLKRNPKKVSLFLKANNVRRILFLCGGMSNVERRNGTLYVNSKFPMGAEVIVRQMEEGTLEIP